MVQLYCLPLALTISSQSTSSMQLLVEFRIIMPPTAASLDPCQLPLPPAADASFLHIWYYLLSTWSLAWLLRSWQHSRAPSGPTCMLVKKPRIKIDVRGQIRALTSTRAAMIILYMGTKCDSHMSISQLNYMK